MNNEDVDMAGVQRNAAALGQDADFEKMLANNEVGNDEEQDSKSETEEDPTLSLQNQLICEKRKCDEDHARATVRKVRKVVVQEQLPSQSGALCQSIWNFVKFMMGMPPSPSAYPPAPLTVEWDVWNTWATSRYNKMMNHLEEFTRRHKGAPKPVFKQMYKDEVACIRKHLSPPNFQPAADVVNSKINIPISIKKACEQDVQIAGRDVALKKMGNQPMLALLFRKETVLDWEDQPIPEKPKRFIPVWRSPAFKMCIQKLNQIALSTTNSTSELKSLTLL
ncbi:hypothetical protein PCASD_18544 [Puccinia coronata f. sp. avenae]|uniref:Uncharacterized protein n=1 Tax=Puccinia coronata f. sp. avenae TaxID=200324 RepID=A0A2N5U125_9BASI|nr:hypothetical protein PCASD_18544 [Puccinia coronata f. sp. avenae]